MAVVDMKRKQGESEYEYTYRVCSQKEQIGTWQDVADLLNKELGNDFTECKYRKDFAAFSRMFDANQKSLTDSPAYLEDIQRQRRELEKERTKLRTEKADYNRLLRLDARGEMIAEQIAEALANVEKPDAPSPVWRAHAEPDRRMRCGCLCFGDEHYGTEFLINNLDGSVLAYYSPEVCEDRMWALLRETKQICGKEGFDTLNVYMLGDFIDGVLRVSQLAHMKYGVIDGTVRYALFLSRWLNALSDGLYLRVGMVMNSNHPQLRMLGQPKGTFEDENMSKVILTILQLQLSDNPNIEFIQMPGTDYIYDEIFGNGVLCVHGEQKDLVKALKDFSAVYRTTINYLIAGHKHHSYAEEVCDGSEVISIPSIMGTDGYAMRLNVTSAAAARLLVFEEDRGKTITYDIKLD